MKHTQQDAILRDIFLEPVRKCAVYQPAFGLGRTGGITLDAFQTMYGNDPFYAWLGMDDPLVYAAHKAAGGLTSVYRQIGIGSERLFRAILQFSLGLSSQQLAWQYQYAKPDGKTATHTLDASIQLADLSAVHHTRIAQWLQTVQTSPMQLQGIVFEVRQGYKSADSKRQNADLRYGVRAYQVGLLPCFVIMSSQVSQSVIHRYRSDGMLVLTGMQTADPTHSTFAFFQQIIGYDLAGFFTRNQAQLKNEVQQIITTLLTP